MFIGDHKLDRVFVHPTRFTDLGYSTVRTVRHTFQAPPNPGLYTFQAYVASDSYVGTDLQVSMSLKVSLPLEGQAGQGEDDDDISDPEEDTIAGQMAAMRGLPTKRRADADDEDEDTSATDSSDSDSTTTTDSSDSDSE